MNSIRKLVLLMVLCASPSLWAGDQGAESFLQHLGDQVIGVVNDDSLSGSATHKAIRRLLESSFAIRDMGRFALGNYWRRATDSEKEEFIDLFRLNVVHNYANRFESYTNEKFEVTGSRIEKDSGGRNRIIVSSKLIRPSGPPLLLDWDIFYEDDGRYLVYDVKVDKISMSITLRSEYGSVIRREGGTVSGLNKVMKAKWLSRVE